ncbi:MAG TPA: ribokinase [Stellaceae bacterium]|nr:ribokinase [Stellaceae bacterium]
MIVVFGSINADLIFPVVDLPRPGQTLLAQGMRAEPGGKGANQAVAAALDGAFVAMAGAVGQDALAETALAGLRAAGVDLARVTRQPMPVPTGCATICTDAAGRNQIVVALGANAVASAAQVEDALLGPDTLLVTQMEADAAETAALILRAHACGARTIHNLAPAAPLDPEALRVLDLLVVNEDEAAWLARHLGVGGEDAAALHGALGVTVIRTLGGAGVEWAGAQGSGCLSGTPVAVLDTTAAGDCFVGVLAAALDRGETLPDALRRANIAAGLACTRRGSQGSLPDTAMIAAAITATEPGRTEETRP